MKIVFVTTDNTNKWWKVADELAVQNDYAVPHLDDMPNPKNSRAGVESAKCKMLREFFSCMSFEKEPNDLDSAIFRNDHLRARTFTCDASYKAFVKKLHWWTADNVKHQLHIKKNRYCPPGSDAHITTEEDPVSMCYCVR
jgi:hypothetical protein